MSAGEPNRPAHDTSRLDAFISYSRRDERQVEIVARALRARGLEVFLDRWYLAPGKSWADELEAVLAHVPAAAVFVGPGEMGPWQQREKNFALDRQTRDPAFSVIPVLLPGSDPALGFLGQNTWVDLRLGLNDERELTRLAAAIRGRALAPADESAAPAICPYRGLLYFREEDAAFFFGREAATAQLHKMVRARGFVAVVGASGSGKSSVVRAGLLPALRRDTDSAWEIVTVVPGNRPLFQLARALLAVLRPDEDPLARASAANRLAEDFAAAHLSLADLVHETLRQHRDAGRLLIVVDQWEELYTLSDDESTSRRFMDILLDAAASGPCHVVLTLRGDFVGRALAYRRLSDRLQDGQLNLGPMTHDELQCAIERPAQRVSLQFEAGLAERIMTDVGDEPGNLPLLEFVLKRLWETRKADQLRHQSYDAMGQLRGAVATKAEEVFAELPHAEQRAVHDLFLHLVRPGQGGEDTRRRATRAELGALYAPLVQKLSDERLLVTGGAGASDEETVEVSHEALIQNWGRLKTWLDQDREFLLWHEWLRSQQAAWIDSDRDDGGLLRGVLLSMAERRAGERSARLKPSELDYIARAVALRDREEQARLQHEAREVELSHTHALAQEQRKRADAESLRAQEQARAAGKLARQKRALIAAVAAIFVLSAALVVNLREQAAAKDRHARAYNLSIAAASQLPENPELATLLALASAEETFPAEQALIPETSAILNRVLRVPAASHVIAAGASDLFDVSFRPASHRLAIAGKNMKISEWDGPSARLIASFDPPANWNAVAFSADGKLMAAGANDGVIRVWEAQSATAMRTLTGHSGAIFDLKFSSDGKQIASAAADGTVRIWDVQRGSETHAPLQHANKVYGVAIAPDGRHIATAGADKQVLVWSIGQAGPVRSLAAHREDVNGVAFSPDGKLLASAGRDKLIALWNPANGAFLRGLYGHTSAVTSVRFSADGRYVISSGHDRSVRIWDPATGVALAVLHGHTDWVAAAAMSSDGTLLASAGGDRKSRVWDAAFLRRLLSGHQGAVLGAAFSRDGTRLVTASSDRSARVWDTATGKQVIELAGHAAAVNGAVYSPDGNMLATASDDRSGRLWNASSGALLRVLSGHAAEVTGVAYSPDGRLVATSSKDHSAIVWEAASGRLLHRLQGHANMVLATGFSPDGAAIASASFDGTAKLWDSTTGVVLMTFAGHSRAVSAVGFSPGGRTLATGSWDQNVILWDTKTGSVAATLRGHTNEVTALAFSADGKILASVGRDQSVRLWDAETGSAISSYPTDAGLLGVAFAPDNTQLAIAQGDGLACLLDVAQLRPLSGEALLAAVRGLAKRRLTPDECARYVAQAACSETAVKRSAQ